MLHLYSQILIKRKYYLVIRIENIKCLYLSVDIKYFYEQNNV